MDERRNGGRLLWMVEREGERGEMEAYMAECRHLARANWSIA